ncbi:fungal-specific transcription factor domain-containing protein [Fennellomyces sp. T-0311]|nr:fungal-specific transcription factor domain-containing protein [Fennellomyces sp. T-0311]
MSSVFVSDNSAGGFSQSQQQKPPEPARPKRPRPSLACIRCRKKKVKCDFVQPTCGRCANAGLPCSYATPPRRVDGQAFDQLGNHVEELKERMQKMQTELAMIKSNLHPFPGSGSTAGDSVGFASSSGIADEENLSNSRGVSPLGNSPVVMDQLQLSQENGPMTMIEPQQPVTWRLSLSPSGLRIDTNIASVADLYRILLNGISQLNINSDSTTNLFSTDSIRGDSNKPRQHKAWGRYAQQHRAKPLESSDTVMAPATDTHTPAPGNSTSNGAVGGVGGGGGGGGGGRLWEVDDNEALKIQQERKSADDTIPQATLDNLMHSCYHKCFLAYQIVDKEAFMQQYASEAGLDPLLANSISAWVAKHGCIYHNACPGKDPSSMGEAYFKNARQLLKKCFDISNATTVHALLNLYMYQLSSERSSLAYLYIGLAIRMAQDLKFHKKEHMPADLKQRETSKRLWWSAYWLDLCAALESNRPTMVDDKDCDLEYPTKLDFEDEETGYRIDFCVHSIKLMKIRKDITKHLPSEQSGQSLLSAISRLENALTTWLNELPQYLRFEPEDVFCKTDTFKDEASLILNIQYQTTWIMLHKFFLPKQNQTATPVALLSLNICTKSANFITKLLDIYAKNLCWCQFFYALDGVIASVSIHQSNALSNEEEVACLAQRNLILTANVLRNSPLLYMEKVNEIIESIESFLKQNNLPNDLSKLPAVNEDLVNQQSIYSVFHPGVFENNQNQQQSQQSVSAATSVAGMAQQATASPSMAQLGPQHQSSPATMLSSSSLSPHPRQQPMSSPIPMTASPQQSIPDQAQARQPGALAQQAQQQQIADMGYTQQLPGATSANMMSAGAGMLFNNPALMGFTGTGGDAPMDQLLFRDMNFMDQGGDRMMSQQDVFASLGSNMLGDTSFAPNPSTGGSFPFTDMSQADIYSPQQHHQQQRPQQPQPPQPQPQHRQNNSSNNDPSSFPGNLFGNPALFGLQGAGMNQPYGMNDASTSSSSGFDPAALFANVNMDQAAMNALLYGSAAASGSGDGMGIPFGQQQQQQQPPTGPSSSANFAAAMYAASRKRVHREWDDSA